ncbi:MAG: hypothetical protein QOH57_3289 [Mycobacterium sp.]|nr:hypothetical protein [Mycobacterium sp.]
MRIAEHLDGAVARRASTIDDEQQFDQGAADGDRALFVGVAPDECITGEVDHPLGAVAGVGVRRMKMLGATWPEQLSCLRMQLEVHW